MPPDAEPVADASAVLVALWRAMHVAIDPPPHVFDDAVGLRLAPVGVNWRQRRDMHPALTKRIRASMVARSRFIEDLVEDCTDRGVRQYVILGAGLDTFAQRRPEVAAGMEVYEVDQPRASAWKRQRLVQCGFELPAWLHFVAVNFEAGGSWMDTLVAAGFNVDQPAVVACAGVSMYITTAATAATLCQAAALALGSVLAMSLLLPLERVEPSERPLYQTTTQFAQARGMPLVSVYAPETLVAMAHATGFKQVWHVASDELGERYFSARHDGLWPSSTEALLLAMT